MGYDELRNIQVLNTRRHLVVDDAFKDDFCYRSATYDDYGPGDYKIVIRNLEAHQPVILAGCATAYLIPFPIWWYWTTDCHMWVCDGYERRKTECSTILYFHMNWGWNEVFSRGNYNGWYFYNVWWPSGTDFNFYNYSQNFVYDIHP